MKHQRICITEHAGLETWIKNAFVKFRPPHVITTTPDITLTKRINQIKKIDYNMPFPEHLDHLDYVEYNPNTQEIICSLQR